MVGNLKQTRGLGPRLAGQYVDIFCASVSEVKYAVARFDEKGCFFVITKFYLLPPLTSLMLLYSVLERAGYRGVSLKEFGKKRTPLSNEISSAMVSHSWGPREVKFSEPLPEHSFLGLSIRFSFSPDDQSRLWPSDVGDDKSDEGRGLSERARKRAASEVDRLDTIAKSLHQDLS